MTRREQFRKFIRLQLQGVGGTDAVEQVFGTKYHKSRRLSREKAGRMKRDPRYRKFRDEVLLEMRSEKENTPQQPESKSIGEFLARRAVEGEPEPAPPAQGDGLRWDMEGDRLRHFRGRPSSPSGLPIRRIAMSYADRDKLNEVRGEPKSKWEYHP